MSSEDLKLILTKAGRAHIARNLDMIIQRFSRGGYEVIVYPTQEGLGAREILRGRGVEGIDMVVCCGGDGTLHHTTNGLLAWDNPPELGYLPVGSTNDYANSLGLPKTLEGGLDVIMEGETKVLDVGDFGGEYFNYVAAFGAFAAVSYTEMLELKANPNRKATGSIIESSLDKGRGYVATVLVSNGTLKVGDIVLAGTNYGKVKAMFNERNQRMTQAGPSEPALILGLNGAPAAGDTFHVIETEQEAREIANKREQLQREQGLRTQKMLTS